MYMFEESGVSALSPNSMVVVSVMDFVEMICALFCSYQCKYHVCAFVYGHVYSFVWSLLEEVRTLPFI